MPTDRTVHVSYVQMKVWGVITDVQYSGVLCCSGGIWPGGKTCQHWNHTQWDAQLNLESNL